MRTSSSVYDAMPQTYEVYGHFQTPCGYYVDQDFKYLLTKCKGRMQKLDLLKGDINFEIPGDYVGGSNPI